MAVWPTTLPGPQRDGLTVTLGTNVVSRTTQAGRVVKTRYGSGAPDRISAQLRFLPADYEIFKLFFERDLNFGLNWFSSGWLIKLGYLTHKAKIHGYPVVTIKHLYYTELSVEMIIKPVAACPPDSSWQTY